MFLLRDGYVYDRIGVRQSENHVRGSGDEIEEATHELEDISADRQNDDLDLKDQLKTTFTLQVVLQIVSVSLLAFHKVSSDAIMPTFLATPSQAVPVLRKSPISEFFRSSGGFGYSSQKIGFILLSQAVVALAAQGLLVPRFIDRVGPLKAYRIVLGIYPFMYIFTPLLPNLNTWLSFLLVVLEAWVRVVLSSIGYICAAIL